MKYHTWMMDIYINRKNSCNLYEQNYLQGKEEQKDLEERMVIDTGINSKTLSKITNGLTKRKKYLRQ